MYRDKWPLDLASPVLENVWIGYKLAIPSCLKVTEIGTVQGLLDIALKVNFWRCLQGYSGGADAIPTRHFAALAFGEFLKAFILHSCHILVASCSRSYRHSTTGFKLWIRGLVYSRSRILQRRLKSLYKVPLCKKNGNKWHIWGIQESCLIMAN